MVVLGEKHLRGILKSYLEYYHRSRTHLSMAKDTLEPRAKQPPELGPVIEIAEVSGLHHRYELGFGEGQPGEGWTTITPNVSLYIFTEKHYSYMFAIGAGPRPLFAGDPNKPADAEKAGA